MAHIEQIRKDIDVKFELLGLKKDNDFLAVYQIVEIFGMSKQLIQLRIRQGKIKSLRLSDKPNGKALVMVRDLKDFFISNEIKQIEHPGNTNTNTL